MNDPLSPILYILTAAAAILAFAQSRVAPERAGLRQSLILFVSLLAGVFFYSAWLGVLMFAALAVWLIARTLHAATQQNRAALLLWPLIVISAAILAVTRSQWFAEQWVKWLRIDDPATSPVARIVGTSYFLLRSLSLWFDLAKRKLPEPPTLIGTVNYLLFFPTLVSGPIDRYDRFSRDLKTPAPLNWITLDTALWRGVLGLFKKVVLADTLLIYAWPASENFTAVLESATTGQVWIAFYAYAARIYLDFSGYSDLAIAVALLIGVRVPENFRAPYLARNITDFWRRWHISLSEWLRDYVFLPAGLRLSRGIFRGISVLAGMSAALFAFAICGLWHGLAWHYLVWGLLHGGWVFAHKTYMDITRPRSNAGFIAWSRQSWFGHAFAVCATFHGVAFTWIFFAAPDLSGAWLIISKLIGAA